MVQVPYKGEDAMKNFYVKLLLLISLLLSACSSIDVQHYRQEQPKLELKRYLNGDLRAWGMFTDRFGEVVKRFEVRMTGRWEGDKGVLEEDFIYSDGSKQRRVWHIEETGPGQYRGRADDVIGEAIGEASGNALRWRYTLALPIEGRTWHVQFDDWMFLINDQVMINRAKMLKFGIELGEVTLSFHKE